MTPIICLTGVVGSGKSTVANRFSSSALVVSADTVQFDAVKRAFPFVRDSKELVWGVWSFDPWLLHLNELFHLSLISKYPELHTHQGSIILEGCIVCEEWFRVPLVEEIIKICQLDSKDVVVHHLDLIPPAEVLQEQILRRGNRGDLVPFSDIDFVAQHIEWAVGRTSEDNAWVRFEDSGELETAIKTILESD